MSPEVVNLFRKYFNKKGGNNFKKFENQTYETTFWKTNHGLQAHLATTSRGGVGQSNAKWAK